MRSTSTRRTSSRSGGTTDLTIATKVIIGRNERENVVIETFSRPGDIILMLEDIPGPTTLLRGNATTQNVLAAAALAAQQLKGALGAERESARAAGAPDEEGYDRRGRAGGRRVRRGPTQSPGKGSIMTTRGQARAGSSEIIKGTGGMLVALSGGVDSTFLAKVAKDALGDRAAAVTIKSQIHPPSSSRRPSRSQNSSAYATSSSRWTRSACPAWRRTLPAMLHLQAPDTRHAPGDREGEGLPVVVEGSQRRRRGRFPPRHEGRQRARRQEPARRGRPHQGRDPRALLPAWACPRGASRRYACLASSVPYGQRDHRGEAPPGGQRGGLSALPKATRYFAYGTTGRSRGSSSPRRR